MRLEGFPHHELDTTIEGAERSITRSGSGVAGYAAARATARFGYWMETF
jgi:hypothetical protein